MSSLPPKRIGIVGYGSLGQYLFKQLVDDPAYKIVFVWNRTVEKLGDIPPELILSDLNNFSSFSPDLIIEVAHSSITEQFGPKFLQHADYFAGISFYLKLILLSNYQCTLGNLCIDITAILIYSI